MNHFTESHKRIVFTGNSLCVRFKKAALEMMGFEKDTPVTITYDAKDDRIIIQRKEE